MVKSRNTGHLNRLVPLLVTILFCIAPKLLFAELQQSVRLDVYNQLSGSADTEQWHYAGFGTGRIDLRSSGNRMVQGRLVLDALVSDAALTLLDISRASLRFRFPVGEEYLFRISSGKDRLSWGDGVFFNAADLLYGSSTSQADFSGETLRDETSWMLSGFFPLGQYAFFEPVILPPQEETSKPSGLDTPPDAFSLPGGPVSESSAGFRLQFKAGGIKMESSYLFRGREQTHQAALSMQGHFLLDWYLSASSLATQGTASADFLDAAHEELTVSFGLLHMATPAPESSLSLRLETLVQPAGEWQAPDSDELEALYDNGEKPRYALLFFPELIWSPSRTLNTYFRSVISPLDSSAMVIPGFSWNIYQGFSLLGLVSAQIGEKQSLYSSYAPGAFSVTTGLSFIY